MKEPTTMYRPDLKGRLVRAFQDSNPEYWERLQSRPHDIERVREILGDTERHLELIEEEYQQSRHERVAEEAVRVWDARNRESRFAAELVQEQVLATNSIMEQARTNVRRFHELDRAQVEEAGENTVRSIAEFEDRDSTFRSKEEIEQMTEEEKETHFKAEIHAAGEKRREADYQARKLFASTREELIETARENGSEQPEQDVGRIYKSMLNDVDKQFHRDVHEVFTRYGWDYDKKQVEFHANPEPADFETEAEKVSENVSTQEVEIEVDFSNSTDQEQ